jgi:putative restriction endonuclease
MLGYIGVTDHEWFQFLASEPPLDEVNFWRPSDLRTPQQLVPGTPFLFKLRQRFGDHIVGFGIFARHEVLPIWLAWDAFGRKNGGPDFAGLRRQVERLRARTPAHSESGGDYRIGCIMLSEPVFFDRADWVAPPANWPPNAVQGKAYSLASGEGARVWDACKLAATRSPYAAAAAAPLVAGPRYGASVPMAPRLGQGTFRLAVTSAYDRSCTVTGEHSLPALEAAHIRPYGEAGEHEVTNGLLLRSDIHKLFDKGYVGVTPDYKFIVSDRLRADYSNGRSYYPLSGQAIDRPRALHEWPSPDALTWHMDAVFKR